ncbi:MAG: acyltransferase 3 [Gemmataceae bacterium]|nr:acyltransferase 3 [Gemmataceae bacterium]
MRFNNLQILRLVAATGVALLHLGLIADGAAGLTGGPVPWLKMPRVATVWVPVFFAVSGFVLTHALRSTPPGRYLLLRAVRLYPGYWVVVGAVVGLVSLGAWPGGYPWDPAPSAASLLLLPVRPTRPGESVLLVEWTLVYEMFLSVSLLGLWCLTGGRRVAGAAGVWLAVLAAKSALWPGYGSDTLASWKSIVVSAHVVPFLLGAVAYQFRTRGRKGRWAAAAAVVGLNAVAGSWALPTDAHYWLRGVAAGLTVWFLVQLPDVSGRNPLVVAGGYSYGLYLLHFPVILFVFQAMRAAAVPPGPWTAVGVAGGTAVGLGLAFGRLELALYGRLKAALDWPPGGAAGRALARLRGWGRVVRAGR